MVLLGHPRGEVTAVERDGGDLRLRRRAATRRPLLLGGDDERGQDEGGRRERDKGLPEGLQSHACSHVGVVGTATAFGGYPHDVLSGVFDIAGFAMHAVLRVDLQSVATGIVNKLIDTGGTVT